MNRTRERWAETFTGNHLLWTLESHGDVTLFKSQAWSLADGRNYFGTSPVYHVWNGDRWVHSGLNLTEAYHIFEREKNQ